MNAPKLSLKHLTVRESPRPGVVGFQATVCVDGRPFCLAQNAGKGSVNRYVPLREDVMRLDEAIREVGGRLAPEAVDSVSEAVAANRRSGMTIDAVGPDDYEHARQAGRVARTKSEAFDDAIEALAAEGALVHELKERLNRQVLYLHRQRDGLFESHRAESRAILARWLADARLNDKLHAKKILNQLPFDEALEIYRQMVRA